MTGLRAIVTSLFLVLAVALFAGPPAAANDLPIGDPSLGAPDEAPPPDDPPQEDDPPKFYDEEIPDTTDSVIYVVDRSSSMTLPSKPFVGEDGQPVRNGTRLDYVKTELVRSISSLPPRFTFNIVIYSECVELWKSGRVPAEPALKTEAIAWVRAIQPWGWTNTGGATARALSDHGNEVVMLLSDGAPNFLDCQQTAVGDFDTHKRLIRSANVQGAVIHCFGIGLDAETRQFMMQVAQENNGTFRELD